MVEEIKKLYASYNQTKKALVDVMQKPEPRLPVTPKFYKDQQAYEDFHTLVYEYHVAVADRRKEIASAEASIRTAKQTLIDRMEGQVWYPTDIDNLWIGKECDDWPMSEPLFHEKTAADPDKLPQLKFRHISSN